MPFARLSILVLVLASVAPVSVGALHAQDPLQAQVAETPESTGDTTGPAETIAVEGVADDASIRKRLSTIYNAAAKAGWLTEIDVVLNSGIVTLKGRADSEEHRQWAENVARKTEDVVAVINELVVDQQLDLESTRDVVTTSLNTLWTDFLVRSPLLLAAAVIVVLTGLFAKLTGWTVHRLLDQRGMRASLKDLVYQFTNIIIWIIGLLVATVVAFPGMTPSKALTVLGLGSVAIGFAFKDIFENFFAGILILWRYPFDRGDFITCGDLTGKVLQITIRNTMIQRLDGELAVVPNATLFKNNVDVLTSQPQRRVRIICGVAYDENVEQARDVIKQAVLSCDSVLGGRWKCSPKNSPVPVSTSKSPGGRDPSRSTSDAVATKSSRRSNANSTVQASKSRSPIAR